MTSTTTTTVTAADLLADLHRPGEHVAICHQAPGAGFAARVVPAPQAAAAAQTHEGANVWHSVNPVRRDAAGRGTSADVTRLAALWGDLDVKPGALSDLAAARAVADDLAAMLGVPPAYIVATGGGLHPYWLLDDPRAVLDTDDARTDARALLTRWGRLVTRAARAHGADGVDNVFDLARVLRTPGTVNMKPGVMAPVTVEASGGRPLTVDEVEAALDGYGQHELPGDRDEPGQVQAPRAEWPPGNPTPCPYVARIVAGLPTDVPKPGGGRHFWAYSQAVRLYAARRLGCLDDGALAAGLVSLQARLDALRAPDGSRPGEVADDLAPWALDRVARKTEEQVRAELSGHEHTPEPIPPVATLDDDGGSDDKPKRQSAAAILTELALERYTFGTTPDGDVFGVGKPDGHVVRMLRGGRSSLRAELAAAYRKDRKAVAGQQALADAVLALEGEAQEGEPVPVHMRVAADRGAVWLDLGDAAEHAVKIHTGGWSVESSGVPVLFRRTALTGALPEPEHGGDVAELWDLLNVAEPDRPLVLAWLVAALGFPDIPHPVLALLGEQGTGKSTASRMLVSLVDPSPVPLRKPPKDADGWVTAAAGSWVVGLDNMSTIPDWLSDTLCRAVTGDGDVRRQLYTDAGLAVFAFRRAILLNGIDVGAVRNDLADRAILVNLDRIRDTDRRTESSITQAWAKAWPRIVGALLTEVAGVLHTLPSVRLGSSPRMADFAMVVQALDQMHGTTGLARYADQAESMAADALASDPFLARMAEEVTGGWDGTAAELRALVTPSTTPEGKEWRPPRDWPKDSRAVTALLRRNAPALRRTGWTVTDHGRGGKGKAVRWTLEPPTREVPETSPAMPAMPADATFPHVSALGDGGRQVAGSDTRRPPTKSQVSTHTAGDTGVAGDDPATSQVERCPACDGPMDEASQIIGSAICGDCTGAAS